MGAPVPFRELAGAFIVDPPAAPTRAGPGARHHRMDQPDRRRSSGDLLGADDPGEAFVELQPRFTFMINGLSWPATERLTYALGETVRWRVINLSSQAHPMHLHGFYFEVDSLGDGWPRRSSRGRQPRRS